MSIVKSHFLLHYINCIISFYSVVLKRWPSTHTQVDSVCWSMQQKKEKYSVNQREWIRRICWLAPSRRHKSKVFLLRFAKWMEAHGAQMNISNISTKWRYNKVSSSFMIPLIFYCLKIVHLVKTKNHQHFTCFSASYILPVFFFWFTKCSLNSGVFQLLRVPLQPTDLLY